MSVSDFFSCLKGKHPGLSPWLESASDIQPLASPSGHSWLLISDQRLYVLRVPGRRPPGADWHAESHALDRLAKGGWVPKPLYVDADSGLLLREWVEGDVPGEGSDPLRPVRLLARAHKIQLPELRTLPLDLSGVASISLAGSAQVARAFHPLPPLPQTAVCHNDPHPGNFILGPDRDWLLDWEYVGWNDPLRDLAYFAAWEPGPLDPPFWLTGYGVAVREGAVARFEFGVALADALCCMWWHQTGAEVPVWRWERVNQAVHSPRWAGTLRLAGIPPTETTEEWSP